MHLIIFPLRIQKWEAPIFKKIDTKPIKVHD